MGGPVPLGYNAVDRKLEINEAEAETVRHIHDRYLTLGSILHLKVELDRCGIVSKGRTSKTGRQIGDAVLAAQAAQHDADLFLGGVLLARRTADVSDDLLGRLFACPGFLSHLYSLTVTMSQKSSLVQ